MIKELFYKQNKETIWERKHLCKRKTNTTLSRTRLSVAYLEKSDAADCWSCKNLEKVVTTCVSKCNYPIILSLGAKHEWLLNNINLMIITCPLLPKARTRMDAMTTNRSGNEKLKGKFLIFDMWVPLCKSFFLERKQTSFLVWFDLQTIWLGGGMPFAQNAAAGRGRIIPQKKLNSNL